MLFNILNEELFFNLNLLIKLIILIIIIIKCICLSNLSCPYKYGKYNKMDLYNYNVSTHIENITNIENIFFKIINLSYVYSQEYQIIEIKYFISLYDKNNNIFKPSDLSLRFDLHLVCDIFIVKSNNNIYSFANIYKDELFFCIEYINIFEKVKLGIKIFKINENFESFEHFFFSDQIIKIYKYKLNQRFENNNKFNINNIYNDYNKLVLKNTDSNFKETYNLKSSFLKPPLCYYKRDISHVEGKWYFNNLYGNYFCFCKGENCLNIISLKDYFSQACKYYFYLTIIDNNRNLYIKSHYLLSDFFRADIESSDAYPIFKEMIKENINAHYVTMSREIYDQFCLNNINCQNNLQIDNLFRNIEYITYIFLGHGVQYIKSYLYKNYLSCRKFDKILLPPNEKIINIALEGGWKIENIIKIGLPKWDNYLIYGNNNLSTNYNANYERAIFLMFTWRKVKYGKKISDLYFNNLYSLLNNKIINKQLRKNHIKIYYCFHHKLRLKNLIKKNSYIKFIKQTDISTLLKNSSLIITDFSAIMFDAIIQKKPLILYIPDALDQNLKDLYTSDYYDTIYKLKNGFFYLFEIFFNLNEVIKKILYYTF